jgi:type III pantothenate kinase
MLLAIDIGNTHTVLGLFRKGKLVSDWRIASTVPRTEDELWLIVQYFYKEARTPEEQIFGVVIASVVPRLTDIYCRMAAKYLQVQPLIITAGLNHGITILYDPPAHLGADRICNAVAAFKKFGGPAIVVDFGTATTFDIISKKGEYLGGVIAPGLETAAGELHRRTALLPKFDLQFPEKIIGTNTVSSLQSGVLYSAVDATDGMVRRLKHIIGRHANIIATGGYARIIAQESEEIKYIEPSLVLEGARLIYERVTKEREHTKSLFS